MRPVSPRELSLARRLLRAPLQDEDTACDAPSHALIRSCEALRPRLTQLVGREGFRALLSRGLALARQEQPWLCSVSVDAEGSLIGLTEALAEHGPAAVETGSAAVLGHVLGLLVTFIGAELTRQLVSSAWPETPVENADFGPQVGDV